MKTVYRQILLLVLVAVTAIVLAQETRMPGTPETPSEAEQSPIDQAPDPFVPSEEINPDSAVPFPTDI